MTNEEMLKLMKSLVGDSQYDDLCEPYLEMAKSCVVEYLFPFSQAEFSDVPEKHHMRVIEIAIYLLNKRGAEGETSHSENGTNRGWESSSIPQSMFAGMIPYVGVPK